jgi:VanZ family protein
MAALVLYASLYPFTGWRWPVGQRPAALLALPWPPWQTPLDEAFNFAATCRWGCWCSLPRCAAAWRRAALRAGAAAAGLLSYATEVTQHLLPGRHPSLKDWLMNTLGAPTGALLARCCTCSAGCSAGTAAPALVQPPERRRAGAADAVAGGPAVSGAGALGPGQVGDRLREAGARPARPTCPGPGPGHAAAPPTLQPLGRWPSAWRRCWACWRRAAGLRGHAAGPAPGGAGRRLAGTGLRAGMTVSTLLNFGPSHAWPG